jgi:hypothetical protein
MSKQVRQSELTLEKLIDLSINISGGAYDKHFIAYHTAVKRSSPILSPASTSYLTAILDKAGAVNYLAEAKVRKAISEEYVRGLWKNYEYHATINGLSPILPKDVKFSGRSAEDIMEGAVRLKVVIEEIAKLEKKLSEEEMHEKQSERRRRLHQGVVKRDGNGKIWMADGMSVGKDGIITNIGVHIDQYMAECQEVRLKQTARLKQAEADASA